MTIRDEKLNSNASGIFFQELPHSKPIRRFVTKKIQSWLRKLNYKEADFFRVEFNRTSSQNIIGCHIEIISNGRRLKSSHYGRGIQQAFSRCLKNIA